MINAIPSIHHRCASPTAARGASRSEAENAHQPPDVAAKCANHHLRAHQDLHLCPDPRKGRIRHAAGRNSRQLDQGVEARPLTTAPAPKAGACMHDARGSSRLAQREGRGSIVSNTIPIACFDDCAAQHQCCQCHMWRDLSQLGTVHPTALWFSPA